MRDLVPGAYLYDTRIGNVRGALSYAWLEVVPWVAMLGFVSGHRALIAIPAHWAFLSLYELGYLYNDGARTRAERTTRRDVRVASVPRFVAARCCAVALVAALVGETVTAPHAAAYGIAAAAVVLLSIVHTRVGERVARNSPLRWLTFAWLAFAKYLPAAVACVEPATALALAAWYFLLYGGGRVVEYAVAKHHGSVVARPLDVNSVWFLCGLPAAIGLTASGLPVAGALAGAGALALHHGAVLAVRMARS